MKSELVKKHCEEGKVECPEMPHAETVRKSNGNYGWFEKKLGIRNSGSGVNETQIE